MTAYRLERLAVGHGGRPVCRVDRLEIPAGRITALVGANGAGKTTLLEVLAFLRPPQGGTVRFFGEPVDAASRDRCRLEAGLLLQRPYLFDRTVADNVGWGLAARGVPRRDRAGRVARALAAVGLEGFGGRRAARLSGGEAQRVALARLLVLSPRVLLLDEPTNHLDAASRDRIEAAVARWVRDEGGTAVWATHDPHQVRRVGATVWRVEDGRVRPGEPDNVFRGEPDPARPGAFVTGGLRLFVHPLPAGARCVEISPREVVLAREDPPSSSARNRLRGTVVRAEVSGDEVWVTLDCGEPVVAVVTRPSWERLGLTVGGPAVAVFKATAARAY